MGKAQSEGKRSVGGKQRKAKAKEVMLALLVGGRGTGGGPPGSDVPTNLLVDYWQDVQRHKKQQMEKQKTERPSGTREAKRPFFKTGAVRCTGAYRRYRKN